MALSAQQQSKKLLSAGKRPLIVLPKNPSGDALGAGYGFAHTLAMLGYDVTIAVDDPKHTLDHFSFLAQPKNIVHSLRGTRDFILTFKTSHNDILDVATERKDDTLRIRVTPEKGMIDTRDFSFGLDTFPYDVIISIGLHTKERAGRIYHDVVDLFYEVPLINIDNNPANENFGHVNIVLLTASSLSEIVAKHARDLTDHTMTPEVAECFLTGIITATDSFRATKTTPTALSLAGDLIDAGADQQKIITHLFKSQPLNLVRLWGRVLHKVHTEKDNTIIISSLTQDDFAQTQTGVHFLPTLLEKLKQLYAQGKVFMIIYEHRDAINALISVPHASWLPVDLRTNDDDDSCVHDINIDARTPEDAEQKILRILAKTPPVSEAIPTI